MGGVDRIGISQGGAPSPLHIPFPPAESLPQADRVREIFFETHDLPEGSPGCPPAGILPGTLPSPASPCPPHGLDGLNLFSHTPPQYHFPLPWRLPAGRQGRGEGEGANVAAPMGSGR